MLMNFVIIFNCFMSCKFYDFFIFIIIIAIIVRIFNYFFYNRLNKAVRNGGDSVYGIAVLTDNGHDGKSYAECMKNYCTSAGIFPLVEIYKDAEMFFRKIQDTVPDLVFLMDIIQTFRRKTI